MSSQTSKLILLNANKSSVRSCCNQDVVFEGAKVCRVIQSPRLHSLLVTHDDSQTVNSPESTNSFVNSSMVSEPAVIALEKQVVYLFPESIVVMHKNISGTT